MKRPSTLNVVTAAAVLFSILLGLFFLARAGLPSADIFAKQAANRPIINVSDFNPGDVEYLSLNGFRVIVWRRDEADRLLAASQDVPEDWRYQNSRILGQDQPVFASDANLTLNDEWFFVLAEFSNPYQYLLLRAGELNGFFEGRYATHFDLTGRVRKGGSPTNLTVIEAEYVNDGNGIQLYLDGKP